LGAVPGTLVSYKRSFRGGYFLNHRFLYNGLYGGYRGLYGLFYDLFYCGLFWSLHNGFYGLFY
jgi:hypothetical protein